MAVQCATDIFAYLRVHFSNPVVQVGSVFVHISYVVWQRGAPKTISRDADAFLPNIAAKGARRDED
jgi:hypothetical protein